MRTRERENERQESEQKKDKGLKREPRLFLFVCWIPAFLAYYPTLWTYDANMQIPALRGMALLSLIQMLLLSGMFAYGIEKARGWSCGCLCRRSFFIR